MRVALVHSFYRQAAPSGENAQVEAERDTLAAAGVDTRLFAISTDDVDHEPGYGARAAVRVATGRGRSPLAALATFGPDVVHVHNLFPNYGRRWVRQVPVPVVATVHNYRFTCAGGTLFRDGHQCTDCGPGRPWPGLRHRCYRDSLVATAPLSIAQLRGPAGDPVLARADRILCLSDRQRGMLAHAGVDAGRLVGWSNFLPDAAVPPPPPPDDPTRAGALFAGRLDPEKGVLDLVRAWPDRLPLVVAGDGPELAAVRRAAAGRPITVLGAVPRSEVVARMARSRVLVLPSTCPEASRAPLVYMEALGAGLPTVVLRSSEVAGRVAQDRSGLAVAGVADIPAAVEALAADPDVAGRCRRAFEAEFTADRWIARVTGLYGELAGGAPTGDAAWRRTA